MDLRQINVGVVSNLSSITLCIIEKLNKLKAVCDTSIVNFLVYTAKEMKEEEEGEFRMGSPISYFTSIEEVLRRSEVVVGNPTMLIDSVDLEGMIYKMLTYR